MTRQGHIQGLHRRDHSEKSGGTSQDQNGKNALGGNQRHQGGWSSIGLNYGTHGKSGHVRILNIGSGLPSETFFCFVTRSFLLQLKNVDPMFRSATRSQSGKQ